MIFPSDQEMTTELPAGRSRVISWRVLAEQKRRRQRADFKKLSEVSRTAKLLLLEGNPARLHFLNVIRLLLHHHLPIGSTRPFFSPFSAPLYRLFPLEYSYSGLFGGSLFLPRRQLRFHNFGIVGHLAFRYHHVQSRRPSTGYGLPTRCPGTSSFGSGACRSRCTLALCRREA